jgi:hypothetical protein
LKCRPFRVLNVPYRHIKLLSICDLCCGCFKYSFRRGGADSPHISSACRRLLFPTSSVLLSPQAPQIVIERVDSLTGLATPQPPKHKLTQVSLSPGHHMFVCRKAQYGCSAHLIGLSLSVTY